MRAEAQGQPGGSGSYPPAIHRQSQVIMRRGAVAIVTATTSLTTKPTRMRMMGNHFLLSASGCPCLTMAQHTRSVSPIFSRALPAIVKHCSKFYQHLPKSHSVLGQGSGVAAGSCVEGPLPSPAPSAPKAMDKEMSSDCIDISRSSRNILPTLIEVTFRPQSPDCCSFTAVIPDGCDGRGVSFGRLARLVESTSHVGKIGDFTIQPIKQHSFLVTGFSRHASPRLSSGITLANAAKASPIHRDAIHIRHQTWQSRSCRGSCIARELAVQQR